MKKEILNKIDHTMLKQTTRWEDVRRLCDEAIKFNAASVCIPTSFVADAKKYVKKRIKICTVIGFPNGYNTTKSKIFETKDAIKNGAEEIDMVINIGWLKDKKYELVLNEIRTIKKVCRDKILKVIIETCLLNDDEKIIMCDIINSSGADFIKTSTGFSSGGATIHDVQLFATYLKNDVKIKVAGGIDSFDEAEEFIRIGADRIGSSKLIKQLIEEE